MTALIRILFVLWLLSPATLLAFPQVAATNTSTQASAVTTHTVNLPAGIVAGDLVTVLFAVNGNPSITWPDATWIGPEDTGQGGLQVLAPLSNGTAMTFELRSRIADGTEGASISIITSTSQRSAHHSFRIRNADAVRSGSVQSQTGGNSISGSDANADPPGVPSGSSNDSWLWIVAAASDADAVFSADPTSYGDILENDSTGGTAGVKLRSLRRSAVGGTTENPSVFTNTSRPWLALTVRILAAVQGFGRRAIRGGP